MKKHYFTFLFLLSATICSAQTQTVTIDWSFNSTPSASGNANSSRTIEVGDTVQWNWYSGGTHNVKSSTSATETFESQFFTMGGTFSHTFTQEGSNDYVCSPHSGNMFGTITVVAEGTLSTERFNVFESVKMYPNPTESEINFSFDTQNQDNLEVKIYNLLGKEVISKKVSQDDASILVANLDKGIYIVRIYSDTIDGFTTKRFVKL